MTVKQSLLVSMEKPVIKQVKSVSVGLLWLLCIPVI